MRLAFTDSSPLAWLNPATHINIKHHKQKFPLWWMTLFRVFMPRSGFKKGTWAHKTLQKVAVRKKSTVICEPAPKLVQFHLLRILEVSRLSDLHLELNFLKKTRYLQSCNLSAERTTGCKLHLKHKVPFCLEHLLVAHFQILCEQLHACFIASEVIGILNVQRRPNLSEHPV